MKTVMQAAEMIHPPPPRLSPQERDMLLSMGQQPIPITGWNTDEKRALLDRLVDGGILARMGTYVVRTTAGVEAAKWFLAELRAGAIEG